MTKSKVFICIHLDIKKYDSDICSLDVPQTQLRRVSKTLPSNKNNLKLEINHAKCHITKSYSFG